METIEDQDQSHKGGLVSQTSCENILNSGSSVNMPNPTNPALEMIYIKRLTIGM